MALLARIAIVAALAAPFGVLTGLATSSSLLGAAGATIAMLGWLWPESTLLGLMALAPLCRSPKSDLFSPQLLVVTKMLFAIILGIMWWIKSKSRTREDHMPGWLVAWLVGWAFLSILTTLAAQSWQASVPHLIVCIGGVVLFLLVWHSENSFRQKLAAMIGLTAVAVACISLLQYAMLQYHILPALWPFVMSPKEQLYMSFTPPAFETPVWRIAGTFMNANTLGTYFYMLVPFACASMSMKALNRWQRVAVAGVFLLMLAGLYTTNSRGSMLGACISLGYLAVHRGHRWLAAIAASGLAIAAALYIANGDRFVDYLRYITRVEYGLSSRGTIWANGVEILRRFPLTGVGPGNFPSQYDSHFGFFVFDNLFEITEQAFDVQIRREKLVNSFHAHNTSLQVMAEHGILGLPLFLFGVLGALWHAERRAQRLPSGSFGRSMALGAAAFCMGYLVASNFDSYASFTEMGLMFLGAPLMAMGLRSV